MNEKELAEIEARVDPFYAGEMNGKWVEETDENGDEWIRIPGGHDVKFWNIEGSSGCCYAVTHFIAHARQDVPALVAEVRRSHNEYRLFRHDAGAEIERLRAENEQATTECVRRREELIVMQDRLMEREQKTARLIKEKAQLRIDCALLRRGFSPTASAKIERLRTALDKIMHELGVPQPGYLAPVANAYYIAEEALKGGAE